MAREVSSVNLVIVLKRVWPERSIVDMAHPAKTLAEEIDNFQVVNYGLSIYSLRYGSNRTREMNRFVSNQ